MIAILHMFDIHIWMDLSYQLPVVQVPDETIEFLEPRVILSIYS